MRIKHLVLLSAAALLSLSAVAAPQGAASEVVQVRAAPAQKVYLDPVMHKRMQGTYRLDDGRTLKISSQSRKLFADVGNGPTEIVHVGNDRFEAIGKEVSLRFEDGPYPEGVFFTDRGGREVASAQR